MRGDEETPAIEEEARLPYLLGCKMGKKSLYERFLDWLTRWCKRLNEFLMKNY